MQNPRHPGKTKSRQPILARRRAKIFQPPPSTPIPTRLTHFLARSNFAALERLEEADRLAAARNASWGEFKTLTPARGESALLVLEEAHGGRGDLGLQLMG